MTRPLQLCLIAPLSIALSACASSDGKYPELFLSDFDQRIQGTFNGPTQPSEPLRAAPLDIASAADLRTALNAAQAQHQQFLAQAERVRPLIASAAGLGPEDNAWSRAQIEIGDLELRNSETLSLLIGLDSLYADATMAFMERGQIKAAREQVSDLNAAERQMITEFLKMISTNSASDSQ